jgi:hypothetical protein
MTNVIVTKLTPNNSSFLYRFSTISTALYKQSPQPSINNLHSPPSKIIVGFVLLDL